MILAVIAFKMSGGIYAKVRQRSLGCKAVYLDDG